MKKLLLAIGLVLFLVSPSWSACPGGGNFCSYWRTDYTGGATTDLDGIAAADPPNGSIAFVVDTTTVTVYKYNTTSGVTENVPDVVAPDDATNERWLKVNSYSKLTVTNKGASATLTALEMNGMVFVTATATITLPPVIIGDTVCAYSTTAAAVHIDANVSDRIILDGTALDDGDKITSESGAGDYICLIGDSASGWTTLGRVGTWTDGGA